MLILMQALPTEWPQPAVSILPVHLPLLERARREIKNPQREAILLAAVTITERLQIEIERLLAIARDNVSRDIRARLRPEVEAVLPGSPQRFSSMPVRPPQA